MCGSYNYEDGDLTMGLRGRSVNCFGCQILESGRIAIKSSAIESRQLALFKTSKIIQKYFFITEKNDFENFHFRFFSKDFSKKKQSKKIGKKVKMKIFKIIFLHDEKIFLNNF